MSKLQIIDLHVNVEGKEILKGVNLEMNTNEFHVIMGPNGTGKSTLAATIMGHYKYQVTKGQILLDGEDVLSMSVDERSRKGLFLAMQYPSEITGVTNSDFIKTAMHARLPEGETLPLLKFIRSLDKSSRIFSSSQALSSDLINLSNGSVSPSESLACIAVLIKSEFVTPVISLGYCIARNKPFLLLSSTLIARTSSPSSKILPSVT